MKMEESAGSYPEMKDKGILCVGSSAAEWGRNPREVSPTLTRHRQKALTAIIIALWLKRRDKVPSS